MRLAYALTATDMRMRENDVTLGIPKTSYTDFGSVWPIINKVQEQLVTVHPTSLGRRERT